MNAKSSMIIKFDGNEHQIDANTLITVLTHYCNIVSIANQEYGDGNRNVKLNVEALEKGSFDVVLSLSEGIKTLFSNETVQYLSGLSTIVMGVFGIYKVWKGKPVNLDKDINEVKVIVNGDNNIVNTAINIYNTPIIREAVSKSIEKANEDANVEGLCFGTNNKEPIRFSKSEFPEFIYKDFDRENLPKEQAVFVDAYLTITALNFESGGNWKFLYNGFSISMSVKDDALMREINNGARFGKGDTLKVKLKINQRYKEELKGFVNVSYKIEEFYEHIPAPKQQKLIG